MPRRVHARELLREANDRIYRHALDEPTAAGWERSSLPCSSTRPPAPSRSAMSATRARTAYETARSSS